MHIIKREISALGERMDASIPRFMISNQHHHLPLVGLTLLLEVNGKWNFQEEESGLRLRVRPNNII